MEDKRPATTEEEVKERIEWLEKTAKTLRKRTFLLRRPLQAENDGTKTEKEARYPDFSEYIIRKLGEIQGILNEVESGLSLFISLTEK